jgi:hypothetical protein
MKKLTATIAKALAETARISISKKKDADTKSNEKSVTRSREFQKLKSLHRQQEALSKKFNSLKQRIEEKNNISINAYRKLEITTRRQTLPDVTELKNAIIIANHVEGVDESKVLNHVIKKYA